MTKFITRLEIDNYKSIKKSKLDGCLRINLIIGKPNVGKSNLLEALSLFSLPFLRENKFKSIQHFIRLENETELFYKGRFEEHCLVRTNLGEAMINYIRQEGLVLELKTYNGNGLYSIDHKLNMRFSHTQEFTPFVRKYTFNPQVEFRKGHNHYLVPPYGYNLLNVIEFHEELREAFSEMFAKYNLSLVFDKASQSLKIMQRDQDEVFLIPYNAIADTLQRIIFFKTAIVSNEDSVLLFEEPEAHSFPPFISQVTQEMIYNKSNQYFIATHSPFILNDFLENSRDDLAVFLVDYKGDETVVKRLSSDELFEIYQNGVDLFTNSEMYL